MIDARYEDADETPLRLTAADAEDLTVISALVQDAVFPVTEMRWQPALRRFALLLNRFRWEDQAGVTGRHPPERTQAVLVIQDALHVASSGFDRREGDLVLSLLSVEFEAGADGTGRILLWLAGDGAIAIDVECVNVVLRDVTRPYRAPSGAVPRHD